MKHVSSRRNSLRLRDERRLGRATGGTAQPQMAETVFKNIQVLKGIPVDDFLDTMGIMSAALGFDCAECHMGAGTDAVKWEADTDRKRMARRMTLMVAAINRTNFGNRQVVTCWTCHRGRDIPVTMPTIDMMYGEPHPGSRRDHQTRGRREPSADQILDKYLVALGGVERLSKVTSYVATGHERRLSWIWRRRRGSDFREGAGSARDHYQV